MALSSVYLLHAMLMTGSTMHKGHHFTFECCDIIYKNKKDVGNTFIRQQPNNTKPETTKIC